MMNCINNIINQNNLYNQNNLDNKINEITPFIELEIFLEKLNIIDTSFNISNLDNSILNKLRLIANSDKIKNKYIKYLIDDNLKNINNPAILRTYVILLKDKKISINNENFFCNLNINFYCFYLQYNIWNNIYQKILNNEFGKFIQSFC